MSVPIQSVFTIDKKKDYKYKKPEDNQENADKQKTKLTDKKVKQYVYLYNADETVKQVEVTTGIQNDQFIIVKSGLKAGQEVITGPYSAIQNKLKEGMKVKKVTKDQLFAEPGKK